SSAAAIAGVEITTAIRSGCSRCMGVRIIAPMNDRPAPPIALHAIERTFTEELRPLTDPTAYGGCSRSPPAKRISRRAPERITRAVPPVARELPRVVVRLARAPVIEHVSPPD